MTSQKTSLYDEHIKLNAKMVDFAGWMMPIQYKNLKDEVLAVRNNIGLFDVSHMGEFLIEGEDAVKFADYLVTNDIKGAELKKAIYSPLCRPDGTVIDDLIIYKLDDQRIFICVNASNIKKDFDWIQSQLTHFNCDLLDLSSEFSLLAIQGPKCFEILSQVELGFKIEDIPYYSLQEERYHDDSIILARTGYTGEDGFELFGPHEYIKSIWNSLISKGAIPCGLGARDVLRLEVCYPLYGHEINDDVTPLDSTLGWTVKKDKENFIGKEALIAHKGSSKLIRILLDKGIPRDGYPIQNKHGDVIGKVTSGTMSVVLSKGIAIARVEKDLYSDADEIFVNIRGKNYPAILHKKAFISGGHK